LGCWWRARGEAMRPPWKLGRTEERAMTSLLHGLVRWLEAVTGGLFLVAAVTAFAQVFWRYVLRDSLIWAHELDIALMIWAVWLGAAVGLHRGAHLRITIFSERLPAGVQKVVLVVLDLMTLFFLLVLGIKGIDVIESVAGMTLVSMPVPRGMVFAAAPVGAGLMILLFIPSLIRDMRALVLALGNRGGRS
jgi:TRAP-type transport system small permease protein